MLLTDEPNTFLMPISFVRFCTLSETKPITPSNTITKARTVAVYDACFNCSSLW